MPTQIAIGDIHGMAHSLDKLLQGLPSEGELIFLGDYIDRGPDSRKVIDRLLELRTERPCRFLRGNHEEMALAALDGNRQMESAWLANGGCATLESYGGRLSIEHETFLRQTELFYETTVYLFVHAGLLPGVPWDAVGSEVYLWVREPFLTRDYNWGGRIIVHGHTPTRDRTPEVRPYRLNIDTGAVYGGALTAVLLPERAFHSVTTVASPCR